MTGADLSTTYLGLPLSSPIVASASPLTGEVESARRIADAGAAAVVMPSLFEEEIRREEVELNLALEAGAEHFAEALDYFPDVREIATAADRYLATLADLKAALDVPVIASLNATSTGGWVRYAAQLADAGADAVELNLYHVAADPERSSTDVEDEKLGVVAAVRDRIDVPLAVKLSPYFSSTAHFARRLVHAGADGLVLFNRFYQPDINIHTRRVTTHAELSDSSELLLRLRWAAILHRRIKASIAVSGGVALPADGIKALLAGADAVQVVSALLRHGPAYIAAMRRGLEDWLERQQLDSLSEVKGSLSLQSSRDPGAYERAHYIKVLHNPV